MSDNEDRTVKRSRLRVRHLLPLALLALVPILLAPAGSAKPTPVTSFTICVQNAVGSPSCGSGGSSFSGNTPSTIQLSVTNSSSSTVSIGSADITVPDQLLVEQGTAQPSKYVTTSGQHILFQGINLPGGKSFVATFTADVACDGQFSWPGSGTQKAYSSSDLSGTPFATYTAAPSTTTTIDTGCYLAFVAQPTDTNNAAKIAAGGASQGGPITVGLFDKTGAPMTACPVGYASGCSVDLGKDPTTVGTLTNGTDPLTQPLLQDAGNGNARTATFSNLSIDTPTRPQQFRLTATGHGSFAPLVESASFLIADHVDPASCDSTGHCTITQKQLQNGNLVDSFADLVGVQNFNFMTLSPFTLGTTPQGCTGRIDLGVMGFAESDNRDAGTGSTMTIRFYVDQDQLKARYGQNVGQQFVEICVGGRPVDTTTGTIYDCNDPNSPVNHDALNGNTQGWIGDEVKNGKFTGKTAKAVCNADGYYWGIIGSYQDKLPAGNPVVTSWGGQNIGGKNYRFFDMTIPPTWDWRSGP